jgi:hypothetical protein
MFEILTFWLRTLYQNPMGKALRVVFFSWYSAIMLAALGILWTVYSELKRIGLIDRVYHFIFEQITMLTHVAENCTQYVVNMPALYNCLLMTN